MKFMAEFERNDNGHLLRLSMKDEDTVIIYIGDEFVDDGLEYEVNIHDLKLALKKLTAK